MTTGVVPQREMSDRLEVQLQFNQLKRLNNAGFGSIGDRFQWNSAYDIDPLLGSAAIPGYAEYSALYSYYRVKRMRARVQLVNFEAFDVIATLRVCNTDPSTTDSNYLLHISAPHNKKKLLPAANNVADNSPFPNRTSLSIGVTATTLLGDRAAKTDAEYRSLTTASPADLLWVGLMLESGTSNLFSQGVEVLWTITIWVEFTSFITLLSAFTRPPFDYIQYERSRLESNIYRALINVAREAKGIVHRNQYAREYSNYTELFYKVFLRHLRATTAVQVGTKKVWQSPSVPQSLLQEFLKHEFNFGYTGDKYRTPPYSDYINQMRQFPELVSEVCQMAHDLLLENPGINEIVSVQGQSIMTMIPELAKQITPSMQEKVDFKQLESMIMRDRIKGMSPLPDSGKPPATY